MPSWQRTLFILAFAQFVSSLGFSNIFPFLPFYLQELGTRTNLSIEFWIGMAFSAQATTMMIASPIWGAVADRYGRKLMVERAMFGGGAVFLMMAFVRSAEELVLLRALQGMLTGVVSAVNALAAATVPRDRLGYAMGLIQVSRWVGFSIGPLVGGLVAAVVGYRGTFWVTATLLCLAGFLVLFGIEENFERVVKQSKERPGFLSGWRNILAAPGVKATYSIRFLSWLSQMMLFPLIPLFIQTFLPETSKASSFTGITLAVGAMAMTLGALYLGRLGDRIGHRRVLIGSAFITVPLYFLQILTTQPWQFLVLYTLAGAAAGGIAPSLGALLARYSRSGEEGAVYGLDNSIVAAARAIAPMIGTGIVVWIGLRSVFIAAGLVLLLAALPAFWRLPKAKMMSK
ncbi:MAG TPA: multidrug efflux MFS transporter [Chloroflexi bacterium]|nr:MAG: MFS transporter [Anaerolineaceae bacterium 4572_5.2]HEY84784.1 multidrug efflux MFS transporter [Chloroflexota bacterium]